MSNRIWKERDKKYLQYIQKFLDVTENIKNEDLRLQVINAMLHCDERLTELAEIEIEKLNKKQN